MIQKSEVVGGIMVSWNMRLEAERRLSYIKQIWPENPAFSFSAKADLVKRMVSDNWGFVKSPDFYVFAEKQAIDLLSLGIPRGNCILRILRHMKSLKPDSLPMHAITRQYIKRLFSYLQTPHEIVLDDTGKRTVVKGNSVHTACDI